MLSSVSVHPHLYMSVSVLVHFLLHTEQMNLSDTEEHRFPWLTVLEVEKNRASTGSASGKGLVLRNNRMEEQKSKCGGGQT